MSSFMQHFEEDLTCILLLQHKGYNMFLFASLYAKEICRELRSLQSCKGITLFPFIRDEFVM